MESIEQRQEPEASMSCLQILELSMDSMKRCEAVCLLLTPSSESSLDFQMEKIKIKSHDVNSEAQQVVDDVSSV